MSNQTLLLEKLGFSIEEIEKEGFDVEAAVNAYTTNQIEIFKNRLDILQPIIEPKKQEASIIATKKAKKAIVKALGLPFSDAEMQDVEFDVLLSKGIEHIRTGANTEVSTLQNKIIELTAEYNTRVEAKEQELRDKEASLLNDLRKEKVQSFLNTNLFDREYLVEKELVQNIFLTGIAADKFILEPKENGIIVRNEEGTEALKPDNSAKIDIDYLKEKYLSKLIVKSNGSGQQQQQNRSIDEDALKKIPESMKANLQRLQSVVN